MIPYHALTSHAMPWHTVTIPALLYSTVFRTVLHYSVLYHTLFLRFAGSQFRHWCCLRCGEPGGAGSDGELQRAESRVIP